MQSYFLSVLSTCSIQFHLLLRISSLIVFTPVISEIVSFRTRFGHHILRIFLTHVNWNLSRIFSYVLDIFQASLPYSSTGRTSVLNRLIFVFRPILCVFQILIRLKKAPRALLRRFMMSSVPPPSFVTVAPRQANSSTSYTSSFSIFTLSSIRAFVLITLHFPAFSLSPTLPTLSTSRSVLFCMCSYFDDTRAMSLGRRKPGRPMITWRRTVEKERSQEGWSSWAEVRGTAQDRANRRTRVAASRAS